MRTLTGLALLILLVSSPSHTLAEDDRVVVLKSGLEVPVAGPVEEKGGLVLFRTPDGSLRSLKAEQVREVASRATEAAGPACITEPPLAGTFTDDDIPRSAIPLAPSSLPRWPLPAIPGSDPGASATTGITSEPHRAPVMPPDPDLQDLEEARREVYRLMRLYNDPEGAGRINRINRINRVNRVNRVRTHPPTSLEAYYLRELQEARERLERLEQQHAAEGGPAPVRCEEIDDSEGNSIWRSRIKTIERGYSGAVARAFCEPGERVVCGSYDDPGIPGVTVLENRLFTFSTGSQAWQIYLTKPVDLEFDVTVYVKCTR